MLVRRRRQGCDKRKGRAQIRRHTPARDQQEQDGAQTREEQRGCWREPGQQRYEEGCAEHCDHVLRADADGNRPGEALVRGDEGTGLNASAVAVNRPVKAEKFRDAQRGAPEVNVVVYKIPHNSTRIQA